MRRDTQLGIILGVAILVIIGVFLSTRSSVKEPKMPDLTLTEEEISKTEEIEEIDINELIEESREETVKETVPESADAPVEEHQIKEEVAEAEEEELVKEIPSTSTAKDEALVEGKWEGIEKEIDDFPEETKETKLISKADEQTISIGARGKVVHKVLSNDNLFKISRKYYGDEDKWTSIYEANKDILPNPNLLHVGQELLIPDITSSQMEEEKMVYKTPSIEKMDKKLGVTTRTHTVHKGDTLYSLARKYYDDAAMWIEIYEANEDTIEDKRLLMTGDVLTIPEIEK